MNKPSAHAAAPELWRCKQWYPSPNDNNELTAETQLTAQREGNMLILESVGTTDGAYLLVRLRLDGPIASGSWHATTRQHGELKGAEYSANGQLIISEDGRRMHGLWAGAGYDHKLNQMRIYTGKWELVRQAES